MYYICTIYVLYDVIANHWTAKSIVTHYIYVENNFVSLRPIPSAEQVTDYCVMQLYLCFI